MHFLSFSYGKAPLPLIVWVHGRNFCNISSRSLTTRLYYRCSIVIYDLVDDYGVTMCVYYQRQRLPE